jgi:VCBS repeat-containing protein
VSITITPDNDCPTVPNPVADFIAQEDDPDDIIDLTNVFADAENNTLNITVNNANPALLTQTYNNTTKEITLDYINNQVGTATITINVDDNNGCTSTQNVFVVTVVPQNDAPVGNVDTIAVDESETATTTTGAATSVLTNDTDMENDPLSATLITAPLHHIGSFALSSVGTFTYVHDGSETTTDTFTYNLSDGVSNVTVTATININPVNDCPIVSSATGSITVNEDAPDTTDDLTLRFSDADIMPTPNSLSYTVSPSSTSLATLTVNGSGVLTIAYKDNQTGTDTITITANDNAGCTVDDVFTLTVNPVNDPPVGFTESIRVSESGTVTQTTGGQSSLLVNDTDIESNPLTASLVSTPTNGTLTLKSSGTFTYVHDGSETTTDSFVYKPNDGTNDGNDVTVNISITPVNDCPFF